MVRGKENWNTLNYSKQRLTDDDIAGLHLSQERRTFVEVDFSCNKLTSSGLEAIVKFCIHCPDLCVFKAFKNEIDDAGARHIATLLDKCKSIEEIHLSHNYLTAKGVRTIIRAADWKRHNTESPLWLRLEQNYVASGADFLRVMAQEHSVCGRNDDWRCTSRHCYWKRNIHVPFLHLQRQDWQDTAWTEDFGWEQTWKSSAQEQNRKAKTTTQTAVSNQPKAAKMIEPVEELFRRHDEQREQWVSASNDEKGKQRWAVKQVEEPAVDWAESGNQDRALVGHSKGSGGARSNAKEPESDKTKVDVKEEMKPPKAEEPKEPKEPKPLPKDAKQKKTKEAKQDKKLKREIVTQVKEREAPREAPEAAPKDAKKKLKEPNDPKTSDEKEDAKAAKLEARTLLDAPKIPDGKIEQKWAKKGNKAPPPDVVTESSQTESQATVGGGEQDDSRHVSRSRKHSFQIQEAGLQADINLPPAPFLAPNFMEQNSGVVDNSQVFAAEARLRKATNAKDCMVSKEDENQAEKFIQALNAIIKEDLDPERHCFAKLFGSMSTGFGTKGCDFDVVILSANTPESESTEDNKDVLMKLRKILLDKPDFEIKNVILTARVPILKLEYGGRDVDVSVNNEKALKNSRLLHAYAQLDPLIAEFGIAVKLWAKDAQLCGAKDGHLSSYAFILMALYFLQVGGDEMPSLQQGLDESWATADDDEALFKRVQVVKESWRLPTRDLWTLVAGFFAFYAGSVGPTGQCHPFQWGKEVVSVRLGKRSRQLHCAHATEFHDLKGRQEGHLHIEDPVEQSRNLRDVLRCHPVDHEQVLVSEMRLMDNQCRLQAQAMICTGQMMWPNNQRDFTPMPNLPFGLDLSLLPAVPPVPAVPPMPAPLWHAAGMHGFQPPFMPPNGKKWHPRPRKGSFH